MKKNLPLAKRKILCYDMHLTDSSAVCDTQCDTHADRPLKYGIFLLSRNEGVTGSSPVWSWHKKTSRDR